MRWLLPVRFCAMCLPLFCLLFGDKAVASEPEAVQIDIIGVKGELQDNVRAHLSLEQQKQHPRLTAIRIKRLYQQSESEIKNALYPYGYYKATVKSELSEPTGEEKAWRVRYTIQLNEPIKVKTLSLKVSGEGQSDSEFTQFLAQFPVKVGEVLHQPQYDAAKKHLSTLAEERGYFDAYFTQQAIQLDLEAYYADVVLAFETGKRYRFGEVTFKQDILEEEVLRRFIAFKTGDFYTLEALLSFKNDLTGSDYFETVDVEMQRQQAQGTRVPVEVRLTARKPNKYTSGIGYGTDTGIRGSLGWERRYINRYGHRFKAEAQLSQVRNTLTSSYFIPMGITSSEYLVIQSGYKDEQVNDMDSTLLTMNVSKYHPRTFLDKWLLQEIVSLEYRDESFTIAGDTGHSVLLMPGISWSYVKADNRIYTRHGQRLQLDLRGAIEKVVSDASFIQTRLRGTFIRGLSEKSRVIVRGDFGYTFIDLIAIGSQFNDIPSSIRFFAGGDRSVRGYDYNTLGPMNAKGQVIGGRSLLTASLEYEHKIIDKWGVAAFYDVGNAFNQFSDSLKHGAGLGIRWESPVGLIRVDVANALSETDRPWRLHITVGPDL